jgi:hypothetical protein
LQTRLDHGGGIGVGTVTLGQSEAARPASRTRTAPLELRAENAAAGSTIPGSAIQSATFQNGAPVHTAAPTPVSHDAAGGGTGSLPISTIVHIDSTSVLNGGQPVTTEAQLNAAIVAADNAAAGGGAYKIMLGGNITLNAALEAINLKSGNTLDISGGNYTLRNRIGVRVEIGTHVPAAAYGAELPSP